jgi:hypothetical protein
MPATFAHCLMAQDAIDRIQEEIKKDPNKGKRIEYAQKIGEKNNFVIMGAAGPDYPYLTDILTTSILQISHTWANRMHYENTLLFVREGVNRLGAMDKGGDPFSIRLAWFCGFVSHVIADSYIHPVVNSVVGGPYIFTHSEHGKCELIQDVYIFKKITREDIVSSNPRGGNFGYLHFLEECSDPDDEDKNRVHPEIRVFWKELLEATHPNANEYFGDISPDKWHYNYKGRVNFVVDPGAIFRHVVGLTGRAYIKESEIPFPEREKYITKIRLPDKQTSDYDTVFNKAVSLIVGTWLQLFEDIERGNPDEVAKYIKDWNLDTGVDESQIDLWRKKEG